MPKTRPALNKFAAALAVLMLLLAAPACGRRAETAQNPVAAPTPTAAPSPTPAADRVVLAAPADADPLLAQDAEALLRELAASSGLEFERREQVAVNEITPDVKVLVFVSKPDNLGSLAAAAPQTQFVAFTDQDWNPVPNVTIIRLSETQAAFMAGYLAALTAPNFRVGVLAPSDKPAIGQAFANGVSYFCGICSSQVFPLNAYPRVSSQPSGSPASAWQAGFGEINAAKINVLLVAKEAMAPELMAYLATQDIALIGIQAPPAEGLPRWVATVYADGVAPIREIWPDLLAGMGGKTVSAALKIADSQYVTVADGLVWLSQGKLDLAMKTMGLLRAGQIDPLPVN
jgi:hypothetical protein